MKITFIILLFLLSSTVAEKNTFIQNTPRYKVAEGKRIGVWADWARWTPQGIKHLKETFGFNYILLYPDTAVFNSALTVYSKDNIVCQFFPDIVPHNTLYSNVWAYYLDEPVTVPRADYLFSAPKWAAEQSAKYITGDYKRTTWFINYVFQNADIVMFTSYARWDLFLFWWLPVRPDQRDSWREMKNTFGDKFSQSWVSAHLDVKEFNILFDYAAKLNLDGLWLYAHVPDVTDDIYYRFCEAAVKAGFMERY
jgi:hypothetical protein